MSEGTPIDAIENGDVADAADSQHMQAILNEMNASGADIVNGPGAPQQPLPPQMHQQVPMYNPNPPPQYHQQPSQHRQYVDEPRPPRKSMVSSAFERIVDPLVVSVILFVLSLPVLHTYAGRYASWAFAIGGQLSWLGLVAISLVGGAIFGIYRASRDILGL